MGVKFPSVQRDVKFGPEESTKGRLIHAILHHYRSRGAGVIIIDVKTTARIRAVVLTQYRRVTDGRTDVETDGRKRHS